VSIESTAIIGAGGWGTALAVCWAKRGNAITLWGNNPSRAARLRESRENAEYLPGIKLPESINVTSEIGKGTTFTVTLPRRGAGD